MCGIAGIVKRDPRETVDEARLKRMRDVLRHRGPDGEGLLLDGPVGLGHRRLAIIDVAGGHQPMANEDETIWIVYNGEIYNHAALRPGLEARGHRYRTRSDTETIVHAYEDDGERCVERLDGMFAFALWDRPRGRLLLARDRLGIKPLYYTFTRDELLFASEIKAILAALPGRPALDATVVPEFLATRSVSGEQTFFRDVETLLPGRTLTWSVGEGIRTRRYWQLPATLDEAPAGLAERAACLREHLTAAVRSHLMTDVPLGLFLSGGIDSSALAVLMAGMVREPVRTFSVGFDEPGANARPFLRRLRRLSGGVAARPPARRRAARAGSPCHRPRAFRGRAGRLPRPHEPRRSPDVPGRAADEAGPDEYVGLDREPRAVPGPHGGRVRGGDAGAVQARRLADEGRASRGRPRPRAPVDPHATQDGIPGAARSLVPRPLLAGRGGVRPRAARAAPRNVRAVRAAAPRGRAPLGRRPPRRPAVAAGLLARVPRPRTLASRPRPLRKGRRGRGHPGSTNRGSRAPVVVRRHRAHAVLDPRPRSLAARRGRGARAPDGVRSDAEPRSTLRSRGGDRSPCPSGARTRVPCLPGYARSRGGDRPPGVPGRISAEPQSHQHHPPEETPARTAR